MSAPAGASGRRRRPGGGRRGRCARASPPRRGEPWPGWTDRRPADGMRYLYADVSRARDYADLFKPTAPQRDEPNGFAAPVVASCARHSRHAHTDVRRRSPHTTHEQEARAHA